MSSRPKASILLVGGGSVGAVASVNLERGGLASVTAVCRSNFQAVSANGYDIQSCDHGAIKGFRPTAVVDRVPTVGEGSEGFDYIVCTTKNVADVPPSLSELISPAVTQGKTVIVLVQNGLNIEKPIIAAFPRNIVLSGVSLIGANEPQPGHIDQDFPDTLYVGAFNNPHLVPEEQQRAAAHFVELYSAAGKTQCSIDQNVGFTRWRKLVYNACLNPICAITGLDTGRIRLSDGSIAGLVRPAMLEIIAAAKATGYDLPATVANDMIEMDPLNMYLPPSMLSDTRKGNFIEFENILGEPLREGEKLGVPMPTLKVLYHLCQAVQWKNKELKGLVQIPPKGDFVGTK
jgi:2-dehydropantoate 2-reductase